jgi:hypothetical protein
MKLSQTKPNPLFNFKLKTLATSFVIGSILTLTACETNSTSAEQEEHLEPVAIALKAHDESSYRAILYDKNELPDSLDQKGITLKLNETLELDVMTLCLASNVISPCKTDDHDEEGHDSHEEDENHDDEKNDSPEVSLKANISDSTLVELRTESEHFEVSLKALKTGKTNLEIEIWHGGHADISNQIFEITVQD